MLSTGNQYPFVPQTVFWKVARSLKMKDRLATLYPPVAEQSFWIGVKHAFAS
jgi:hypothetical protein